MYKGAIQVKKRLTGLAAAALAAAMLLQATGCSTKEGGNNADSSASKAPEKTTITLWHVWPDGAPAAPAMKKVLDAAKEKFPDVEIKVDAVADTGDAYKTKIKAAIAAREAPDIFYTWGGGFSKGFVESGKVLQLDPYLNDGTKDKLVSGTLSLLTYNDKIYALPVSVNFAMLYYNTELFEKNNLTPPKTFEEFVEVCKAFKAKGITPLAVGGKDTWTVAMYHNGIALKTTGSQYINDALAGKASFNTPEMKKSVELLQSLNKMGAFPEGALGLNRDEGQIPFLEGQIPMYYNGSWVASSIFSSKVKGKIKAMNMPMVAGGKGAENEFLGGADQTFMLNADVKNKERTVEVYKFIMQNLSRERYLGGVGAPTWKVDYDTSKIENELLVDIVNQYSKATGLTLWWDTVLTGKNSQDHLDNVMQAFTSRITPDEFVSRYDKMAR